MTGTALASWREQLAAWAIPDRILAAAPESPWVLPRPVFTRRADQQVAAPTGESLARTAEALTPPGTVLDVGAGAGAGSLPVASRITHLTAVDADAPMLEALTERAKRLGLDITTVQGTWPATAPRTPVVDVVVCHHVLYNVADLAPFVTALTDHARRRVVVEMAARHPLTSLNELWQRFHGLARPTGPAADDAVAALRQVGITPHVVRWRRPPRAEHQDFDNLVDVTRRRLCLPPDRAPDVAAALRETGVDPQQPPDFGSSGDDVVTIWWQP